MNNIVRNIGVTLLSVISAATCAKTFKYEVVNPHSAHSPLAYPGLDLGRAQRAVFTVEKDPNSPGVQITSLEITFPTAAKLTATSFKKINHDTYRAVVNNAWIYRQLFVDVRGVDFNRPDLAPPTIEGFISEKSVFVQPEVDPTGEHLFVVHGPALRDVTPTRTMDTASAVIGGKQLTLSLKNNLSFAPVASPHPGPREGFVVDALWMGKGQKTLYIPAPFPPEDFDRFEAIGIDITERRDPGGVQHLLTIKFKDAQGNELTLPDLPLLHFLDQAYSQQ